MKAWHKFWFWYHYKRAYPNGEVVAWSLGYNHHALRLLYHWDRL